MGTWVYSARWQVCRSGDFVARRAGTDWHSTALPHGLSHTHTHTLILHHSDREVMESNSSTVLYSSINAASCKDHYILCFLLHPFTPLPPNYFADHKLWVCVREIKLYCSSAADQEPIVG